MFSVTCAGCDILFIITVACACGMVALLWLRAPRVAAVLRACACVLLALIILRPALAVRRGAEKPVLAVLVDASRSMRMSGGTAAAARLLEEKLAGLRKQFSVQVYAFGTAVVPASRAADIAAARCGEMTDLVQALRETRQRVAGNLGGILVFSDGNTTAGQPLDACASELNVPVFPVLIQPQKTYRDAAVRAVKAGDFAFKNTRVSMVAQIEATNLSGTTLTVRLRQKDKTGGILAAQQVRVTVPHLREEVELGFIPAAKGTFPYVVEILPVSGEVTLRNNAWDLELEVLRDRVRVLFLCGQPGPEYAFLRHVLKADPLVDLVSFVILRNPESISLVPENDLALIPFPVNTIFTQDLNNFDLLIFDNFASNRFGFLPEYQNAIADWVEKKGGSLAMLGGRNSFAGSGWHQGPVAALLPVTMGALENGEPGSFTPVVEEPAHPVCDLGGKTADAWRGIGQLEGCHPLLPKLGATVLLRHPWKNWAVMTVADAGKGRVLAVGTHTTWLWALRAPVPELYTRLWGNIVRYLSRSTDDTPGIAGFDQATYYEGQEYTFRLRFPAGDGISADAAVVDPAGNRRQLPVARPQNGSAKASGMFTVSGQHRVTVIFRAHGREIARDTAAITVGPAVYREEAALATDEQGLARLAAATAGAVLTPAQVSAEELLRQVKPDAGRADTAAAPVTDTPWLIVLVLALLVAEWTYRRTKGLL